MKEEMLKRILWILAAAGIALVAAAALLAGDGPEPAAEETARKAAESAATTWLALVDSGQYGKSWRQASALFQKQISARKWEEAVRAAREPVGKLLSRRFELSKYTKTMPGAPDGEYVGVQYGCSFQNKKEGGESVVMMKEKDGSWRVAGYFIR